MTKVKKQRESLIEANCGKFARRFGWWHSKFVSVNNRGVPDRVFIRGGRVIFVEFKATGCKPTELQKLKQDEMRKYGAEVYVIDDTLEFKKLFLSFEEEDF